MSVSELLKARISQLGELIPDQILSACRLVHFFAEESVLKTFDFSLRKSERKKNPTDPFCGTSKKRLSG